MGQRDNNNGLMYYAVELKKKCNLKNFKTHSNEMVNKKIFYKRTSKLSSWMTGSRND